MTKMELNLYLVGMFIDDYFPHNSLNYIFFTKLKQKLFN